MKKYKSLMIMVLSMVLFSCEKENVDVVDNSSPDGSALITKEGEEPASDPLQQTLQWTSFATMQTLYDNPSTRADFSEIIGSGNVVQMEDLIGSTVSSNFKTRFMQVMYGYINLELNPGHPKAEGDPPNPPITQNPPPPPIGDPSYDQVQDYLDQFIDEVLILNCIELYIPNRLKFYDDGFEMTSTAHPLDASNSNQGHKKALTFFPDMIVEAGYWTLWITIQTVNDTYVANNENVIVARPFRPVGPVLPSDPCVYPEYPSDFTLFLD